MCITPPLVRYDLLIICAVGWTVCVCMCAFLKLPGLFSLALFFTLCCSVYMNMTLIFALLQPGFKDMLSLVWERRPSYNHDPDIARSVITTYMKLLYYAVFAMAYGIIGSLAHLVMVNSTWTYGHIHFLWRGASRKIRVVFPPCDVKSLENLSLANREPILVSIGQFRPEKNHALQIRSLACLQKKYTGMDSVKLVLVGSCRGKEDEARVEELRTLAKSLDLTDDHSVQFVLNQPYSVVKQWFGRASVGLHTMWNEHFGIGVVEMMAAGA